MIQVFAGFQRGAGPLIAPHLAERRLLMFPVGFRCPTTDLSVQAWVAEEVSGNREPCVTLRCLACRLVHLVNPASGRVMGR
jgi:hypothetical protein